jgi:hypothetical protein
MLRKTQLTAAVAACLSTSSPAVAATYTAQLTGVLRYFSNVGTAGTAGNITSSTATFTYDDVTGLLTQTGGTFNVRFTTSPASTFFRHSVTGLVLGNGAPATAATFNCVEGNFGANVGVHLCGNYSLGGNFVNESTVSWGPGTATSRTLGGDDSAGGDSQGWYGPASLPGFDEHRVTDYDAFTLVSQSGSTLVLGNAVCLGSLGCSGGFNSGFRWTLTLLNAQATDDGPVVVTPGVPTSIPVGANDTGFADPVTVTVTTQPGQGTITAVDPPGPAAGMTVTYQANIGASGADSFVYSVADSLANADAATVSVSITASQAADDGPVAASPGLPVVIPVGANDTGFTNPVTVTITTPPSQGAVTAISPPGSPAFMTVTYQPNVSASGADSFVYTMTDTLGNTDTGTVSVTISAPTSTDIVSNLAETYNFGAGLGGVFQEASSFTTGVKAYRLDGMTLDLQVNSATSFTASLYGDSAGVPGSLLKALGPVAAGPGQQDVVFTATGSPVVLLPGTKYWVVVEQVAAGSSSWVSTYSTAETSPDGVTIGNDMFYRMVPSGSWTPQATATDAGQFSVQATVTTDVDGDGVYGAVDNCTLRFNTNQCDSDGDGYGNRCDGDMNNNGSTNAQDTTLFRQQLGQASLPPGYNKADINCSGGAVNAQDNTLYKQLVGSPPGPKLLP